MFNVQKSFVQPFKMKRRGVPRPTHWLLLSSVLALAGSAQADVPSIVPVQGVLTDASGVPVNGPHDVTMSLYAVPSGGASVYSEKYTALSVDQGNFTAYLGSNSTLPSDLFTKNQNVWLEVVIDGTEVIKPRFQLGSVPYAASARSAVTASTAGDAQTLGGKSAAAFQPALTAGSVKGNMLENPMTYSGNLTLPGTTTISGVLDVGFQAKNCVNTNTCDCPAGTIAISGGVIAGSRGSVTASFPSSNTQWKATCSAGDFKCDGISVQCFRVKQAIVSGAVIPQ